MYSASLPASHIDWSMLNQLLHALHADQQVAISVVMSLFDHELPEQLAVLDTVIASNDDEAWRRTAHRLGGGCLQLGAVAMAGLCQQIEHAPTVADAAAIAPRLRQSYVETMASLRMHLSAESRVNT